MHGEKTVNLSIRICVNKMENRITVKIKTGYYLKSLTPEIMKLLGSIKSKMAKDENGGNVNYLDITEVSLVYCNIANNNYQQNSIVLFTFAPNKSFSQLLDVPPKNSIFLKLLAQNFHILKYGLLIKILNC